MVLLLGTSRRLLHAYGVQTPDPKKKKEEEKMIAFRAPNTLAGQLDNAVRITGKDRTFLIIEAIKEHLRTVVDRYGTEHQQELKRAHEEFMRSMKNPEPEKPKRKPSK